MIGVIGGTLLLENEFLEEKRELEIKTPFGIAEIDLGLVEGVEVAVIQRHGRKRNKPPHVINHPANFYAFKSLGVEKVIGLGSAGCLREDIEIPALIIPHDYIDFFSSATVYNDSLVYITPGFDDSVRKVLIETAKKIFELACD